MIVPLLLHRFKSASLREMWPMDIMTNSIDLKLKDNVSPRKKNLLHFGITRFVRLEKFIYTYA